MSLQEIIEYGKRTKLFQLKPLKDIEHTVCTCIEIEVIDFDETKVRYSKLANLHFHPKSCDCLVFDLEKQAAIFIEIKSLEKFKKWHIEKRKRQEHQTLIGKQISKFNLPKKIESSVFILEEIIKMSGVQLPNPLKIESIVLTDMHLLEDIYAEQLIEFTLLYLADETISPDHIIQFHLEHALEMESEITEKPYLMNCDDLEQFLKSLSKKST